MFTGGSSTGACGGIQGIIAPLPYVSSCLTARVLLSPGGACHTFAAISGAYEVDERVFVVGFMLVYVWLLHDSGQGLHLGMLPRQTLGLPSSDEFRNLLLVQAAANRRGWPCHPRDAAEVLESFQAAGFFIGIAGAGPGAHYQAPVCCPVLYVADLGLAWAPGALGPCACDYPVVAVSLSDVLVRFSILSLLLT